MNESGEIIDHTSGKINCYPKRLKTARDRFFEKVIKTESCWIWSAAITKSGYGVFSVKSKYIRAHRFSWLMHFGEIGNGYSVLHKCDNPRCVNPEHLFLGTQLDNMLDMRAKNRHNPPKGEMGSKKLTNEKVKMIRFLAETTNQDVIAKKFGITQSHVSRIVSRDVWFHI